LLNLLTIISSLLNVYTEIAKLYMAKYLLQRNILMRQTNPIINEEQVQLTTLICQSDDDNRKTSIKRVQMIFFFQLKTFP
jgi:hypothetical protein